MSQLIENKQNDPVLIANFEPNEIATKSACPPRRDQKTKIQTRKHCAGNAAQKVKNPERVLQFDGRGLVEVDLPRAISAEADAGAAVIVGKSFAVEGAGSLQAVEDDGGVIAEHFDLKLAPSGAMEFVAGREDHSQNGATVENLSVGRDVNVFGSHEAVHGGAIVFEPRGVPGFAELFDLLVHRCSVHRTSCLYKQRPTSDDYKSEFKRTQEKFAGLKAAATKANGKSTSPPFAERRKGWGTRTSNV